jgi:hypothetical protein
MLVVLIFTTMAAHALHLAVEVPIVHRARNALLSARGRLPAPGAHTA